MIYIVFCYAVDCSEGYFDDIGGETGVCAAPLEVSLGINVLHTDEQLYE